MSSHNSQQGLEKSLEQWDGRTNLGPLTPNTSPYARAYAYSQLDGRPAPQSHALVTPPRSNPNGRHPGHHPQSTRTAAGDAGPERSHNEPRKRANLAEIAAAAAAVVANSSGSHAGTPALSMWLDQDMSEEPYNMLQPGRHYSQTSSEPEATAMAIEQSDEHSTTAATIGDWDADEQGYTHDRVWRHRVVKARATRQ